MAAEKQKRGRCMAQETMIQEQQVVVRDDATGGTFDDRFF